MTVINSSFGFGRNVHIVPLGLEYELALAAFYVRNVDKVIIVSSCDKKQELFTERVVSKLKEFDRVEVCVDYADMFDVLDIIRVLCVHIRGEVRLGNKVSLNVSSGGPFVSIAAALSGMYHNCVLYGVRPDGFSASSGELESCGVCRCSLKSPSIFLLPGYSVVCIDNVVALVLEYMYVVLMELKQVWVSYAEFADVLGFFYPDRVEWRPSLNGKNPARAGSVEYKEYRGEQLSFTSRFNKEYGEDMEFVWRFIERDVSMRRRVMYRLTETGRFALLLSGISGRVKVVCGKVVYCKEEELGV